MSTLQRYNTVTATLKDHLQGEISLDAVQKGALQPEDRKSLIRILVSELVKVHGHYPPKRAKEF